MIMPKVFGCRKFFAAEKWTKKIEIGRRRGLIYCDQTVLTKEGKSYFLSHFLGPEMLVWS